MSASGFDRGQGPESGWHASSWRVLEHLHESYPAYLLDYCNGILRNPAAAADAVHDTLSTAEAQFGRLRDTERLSAWLYAIARRHCLSRLPQRRQPRRVAGSIPGGARVTEPAGYQVLDADAHDQETILVVAAALDALCDRDRELLSLAFKHGVTGNDLARVVGISAFRARRLVARASRRFGKAAAVAVVLRRRWSGCEALERILGDWDPDAPGLTPKLRRRLTRHIGPCDTCTWSSGDLTFGPELLAALPVFAPPDLLQLAIGPAAPGAEDRPGRREIAAMIGSLDKDGFPVQPDARRGTQRVLVAASIVLIALVAGGVVIYFSAAKAPPSRKTTVAEVAPASPSPTPDPSTLSPSPSHAAKTPGHKHAKAKPHHSTAPAPGHPGSPQPPVHHSPSPKPKPTKPKPKPSPNPTAPGSPPPFSPTPTPSPTPPPSSPPIFPEPFPT